MLIEQCSSLHNMLSINPYIERVDTFQRKHWLSSWTYALIKKYGEDNGSNLSALLTYYGVLSLFPLLIVFTTVTQIILRHHHSLQTTLIHSVNRYFPILGDQLQQGIHPSHKTGIVLVIGILLTLYGARGVASALQYSLSSIWRIPNARRPAFLPTTLRSFGIIFVGGIGFLLASILQGYIVILGNYPVIKVLATFVSLVIIWITLVIIYKLAIGAPKKFKDIARGAALSAIGLQLLQLFGNIILRHELKNLHDVYGTFALVIGLLFWVYLQSEVVMYGAELDVIRHFHLYPRSLQEVPNSSKKAS
jgi:membrane protein